MLNDTLELNIAAKLYNKCQTDVNNHSNKCSGPNQISNPSLDTPLGPSCYTQCTACDKGSNLPDINILHLKNCTKMPHDTDILCCQPKIFH
jgi:hypothetical protein